MMEAGAMRSPAPAGYVANAQRKRKLQLQKYCCAARIDRLMAIEFCCCSASPATAETITPAYELIRPHFYTKLSRLYLPAPVKRFTLIKIPTLKFAKLQLQENTKHYEYNTI
jgi:hypothetical protein